MLTVPASQVHGGPHKRPSHSLGRVKTKEASGIKSSLSSKVDLLTQTEPMPFSEKGSLTVSRADTWEKEHRV